MCTLYLNSKQYNNLETLASKFEKSAKLFYQKLEGCDFKILCRDQVHDFHTGEDYILEKTLSQKTKHFHISAMDS